jgi:hypothetical protein
MRHGTDCGKAAWKFSVTANLMDSSHPCRAFARNSLEQCWVFPRPPELLTLQQVPFDDRLRATAESATEKQRLFIPQGVVGLSIKPG